MRLWVAGLIFLALEGSLIDVATASKHVRSRTEVETNRYAKLLSRVTDADRPTKCSNPMTVVRNRIRAWFMQGSADLDFLARTTIPTFKYLMCVMLFSSLIVITIALGRWGFIGVYKPGYQDDLIFSDFFRIISLFTSLLLFIIPLIYKHIASGAPKCDYVPYSTFGVTSAVKAIHTFLQGRPIKSAMMDGEEYVLEQDHIRSRQSNTVPVFLRKEASKTEKQKVLKKDKEPTPVFRAVEEASSVSYCMDVSEVVEDRYLRFSQWVDMNGEEEGRDPLKLLVVFFHKDVVRQAKKDVEGKWYEKDNKMNKLLCNIYLFRMAQARFSAGKHKHVDHDRELYGLKQGMAERRRLLLEDKDGLLKAFRNYKLEKWEFQSDQKDPVVAVTTSAKAWAAAVLAIALMIPSAMAFAANEFQCPALFDANGLTQVQAYRRDTAAVVIDYPPLDNAKTWECLRFACHMVCNEGYESVRGFQTCKKHGAASIYWTHLILAPGKWETPACCISSSKADVLQDVQHSISGTQLSVKWAHDRGFSSSCGKPQTIKVQYCNPGSVPEWQQSVFCDWACQPSEQTVADPAACIEAEASQFESLQAKWKSDPEKLNPMDSRVTVAAGDIIANVTMPAVQGMYRLRYSGGKGEVMGSWVALPAPAPTVTETGSGDTGSGDSDGSGDTSGGGDTGNTGESGSTGGGRNQGPAVDDPAH
jgi:uncharacterized membrane protein YgcG